MLPSWKAWGRGIRLAYLMSQFASIGSYGEHHNTRGEQMKKATVKQVRYGVLIAQKRIFEDLIA